MVTRKKAKPLPIPDESLNLIMIPLTALRIELAKMITVSKTIPLGDLMLLILKVYHDSKEDL